jgi:hypothetical protein
MSIDIFNILDQDEVASGEELTKDRKKFKDGFDIGDRFRQGAAFLLGKGDQFSEEALRQRAAEIKRNDLNELLSQERLKARQLGDIIPGINTTEEALQVQEGETAVAAKNRLLEMQLTGQALAEAQITNPGLDLTKLGPGATVSTINALRAADSQRQVAEAKKEKENARIQEQKRYDERMRLQYQDRADNRAAQNRNYQLQIMQLQQADKLKAQERKDRMFMTLMAGLRNLGQGFTI